tara:strand:+ start:27947 stop:28240 length:294 start_codon:yes stop_codon:yes gene_type:complete
MQDRRIIIATTLILLVSFLSYNPTVVGQYSNTEILREETILPARYDVTRDGIIDRTDINAVKKVLEGWESHYDHTDINLDGITDQKDLDVLEEYLAN